MSSTHVFVGKDGPVTQEEVNLAIERVFRSFPNQDIPETKLYGPKALCYEFLGESSELRVRRLCVQTCSGRVVEFENQSIPLRPQDGESVTLGISWQPFPVAESSVVLVQTPFLQLAHPEGEVFDDTIYIGEFEGDRLTREITLGERLDSSDELRKWFDEISRLVEQMLHKMAGVIARLTNVRTPVLQWSPLLQPLLATLEKISRVNPTFPPADLLAHVLDLSTRVRAFATSNQKVDDRDIADLLDLLEKSLPDTNTCDMPAARFHSSCKQAIAQLEVACWVVNELAQMVGFEIDQFPDFLYHEGRLHHRSLGDLGINHESTDFGNVATIALAEGCSLAMMWKLGSDELVVGDFRFGDPEDPRLEILEGPPSATEYHWIDATNRHKWNIEYPSTVQPRDVAVYLPVN